MLSYPSKSKMSTFVVSSWTFLFLASSYSCHFVRHDILYKTTDPLLLDSSPESSLWTFSSPITLPHEIRSSFLPLRSNLSVALTTGRWTHIVPPSIASRVPRHPDPPGTLLEISSDAAPIPSLPQPLYDAALATAAALLPCLEAIPLARALARAGAASLLGINPRVPAFCPELLRWYAALHVETASAFRTHFRAAVAAPYASLRVDLGPDGAGTAELRLVLGRAQADLNRTLTATFPHATDDAFEPRPPILYSSWKVQHATSETDQVRGVWALHVAGRGLHALCGTPASPIALSILQLWPSVAHPAAPAVHVAATYELPDTASQVQGEAERQVENGGRGTMRAIPIEPRAITTRIVTARDRTAREWTRMEVSVPDLCVLFVPRGGLSPRTPSDAFDLVFTVPYEKLAVGAEEYPFDASRGTDMPGPRVTLAHTRGSGQDQQMDPMSARFPPSFSWQLPGTTVHPPQPDFSMPYNVACITMTLVVILSGRVFRTVKAAREDPAAAAVMDVQQLRRKKVRRVLRVVLVLVSGLGLAVYLDTDVQKKLGIRQWMLDNVL